MDGFLPGPEIKQVFLNEAAPAPRPAQTLEGAMMRLKNNYYFKGKYLC